MNECSQKFWLFYSNVVCSLLESSFILIDSQITTHCTKHRLSVFELISILRLYAEKKKKKKRERETKQWKERCEINQSAWATVAVAKTSRLNSIWQFVHVSPFYFAIFSFQLCLLLFCKLSLPSPGALNHLISVKANSFSNRRFLGRFANYWFELKCANKLRFIVKHDRLFFLFDKALTQSVAKSKSKC